MKIFNIFQRKFVLKIVFIVVMLFKISYAATTTDISTLSDLLGNWQGMLETILTFIQFVSAFGGIILIIMGIFMLKNAGVTQPGAGGQTPHMKGGFTFILLGAILMGVGAVAAVLGNSSVSGIHGSASDIINQYSITSTS